MKLLILPVLIGLSVYFALYGGEYSVFQVGRVRAERVELEQKFVELELANEELVQFTTRTPILWREPCVPSEH